ncbi:aspartate carbamoyltransferase catalytic subunit [Aliiroseovarius sp. 2305UL8-7]|uniref:aspartate carbamoyltransferase catalytic subunit n=1 Tax=Aliiroseovarius conchicola TaxID=3121637 RepID=UPI003527856F
MTDQRHSSAWAGILEPGESIIWQGHPRREFVLADIKLSALVFGFVFVGFSTAWMIVASREGGFIWMFGLIFTGLGLRLIYRNALEPTVRRYKTHYTLTNRRAFIATNMPFERRKLASYPIDDMTTFTLGLEASPSVYFDTERQRSGVTDIRTESQEGFMFIDDGERVYQMIRDIQTGAQAGEFQ